MSTALKTKMEFTITLKLQGYFPPQNEKYTSNAEQIQELMDVDSVAGAIEILHNLGVLTCEKVEQKFL